MSDDQNTSHVEEVSRVTSDADDEINLLDYWRVLAKHKMLIAIIVSFAIVVSIIYSPPPKYICLNG